MKTKILFGLVTLIVIGLLIVPSSAKTVTIKVENQNMVFTAVNGVKVFSQEDPVINTLPGDTIYLPQPFCRYYMSTVGSKWNTRFETPSYTGKYNELLRCGVMPAMPLTNY
jgi:hypothetical protein